MARDFTKTVCLIEDDEILGQSLVDRLHLEMIDSDWYQSLESALDAIKNKSYAIIISDINLPDGSGESILPEIQNKPSRKPPVLFITAYGDLQQALHLLRSGASDYITKPFDLESFLAKLCSLAPSLTRVSDEGTTEQTLGISPVMQDIQAKLKRIARFDAPVLISGESGSGKEYAALYLHNSRAGPVDRPFVSVNCAAIPETLLETELFGYEPGAFTDAKTTHQGLFEQARGGTLFLDEIGETPLTMQSKLLRAIQEKTIRRVGGNRNITIDFNLVCATNRSLTEMVVKGDFREDLYYRINIIPIYIPPLRNRPDDISWFIDHFLNNYSKHTDTSVRQISTAARSHLLKQPWKGNIRELNAYLERICILSNNDTLDIEDVTTGAATYHSNTIDESDINTSLKHYLNNCERDYIINTLREEDGHIAIAAAKLGISRKNLWEKMKKYDIDI